MRSIYLGIGTNMGDRARNLSECKDSVEKTIGSVVSRSHTYESSSWGFISAPFYNEVWEVETEVSPRELLDKCHDIENRSGRVRDPQGEGYDSRVIDIDILAYGDQVVRERGLTIPHKFLHMRNFVLVPWSDIAPDFVVPVHERTVIDLLKLSEDQGYCQRV
ncbi:MAG: 2-amino-4-hydroxy-6-hydroxymethyldihydropteridine diphosphokinase [Flavobacteriales bacterium]|nr:2-amino-4-hydroxy-6-hydroxymethyldihydropteridine diphosphokinase [Flavobacteriales bacterium]